MKPLTISILALGLIASLNSFAEKEDHQGHDMNMHKSHSEQTESAEETSVQKTCPVMGGEIDKEIHSDYDGKRVYFCCEMCIATFDKTPEKFLKKLEETGEKAENLEHDE